MFKKIDLFENCDMKIYLKNKGLTENTDLSIKNTDLSEKYLFI